MRRMLSNSTLAMLEILKVLIMQCVVLIMYSTLQL